MKNPDSKWKDYFAMLPPDYSNMIDNYSDEELELLEGNELHRDAINKKMLSKARFELIEESVPGFKGKFSLEEFQYARHVS